ncbi:MULTISPECIES: hypothetical protein [unclassified Streptomyces]|uniref:hypothetical protein n=1 Tax=unclassified Streptomyces TaxID=2593676 RepID=UPI0023657A12|nr:MULTISPECIES: hypothetical protein [unclassified Streptomyces]MDF3140373.1 hypothetical protein [Streptomyces sp. T21Q-yed]WDF39468.1 hypothetical protein PBV52_23015 [Streptomyces sp. T12]
MTAPTETLPLSAECALAVQPGYKDLHRECRQLKDIPLPHAVGIWLVRRCGCPHHAGNRRRSAPAPTPTSTSAH